MNARLFTFCESSYPADITHKNMHTAHTKVKPQASLKNISHARACVPHGPTRHQHILSHTRPADKQSGTHTHIYIHTHTHPPLTPPSIPLSVRPCCSAHSPLPHRFSPRKVKHRKGEPQFTFYRGPTAKASKASNVDIAEIACRDMPYCSPVRGRGGAKKARSLSFAFARCWRAAFSASSCALCLSRNASSDVRC